MNNLLENLNPEQLKAVLHKDGPLLIVAGAGTGKTTVITQRIAYLIEQDLAKADEILALTFTEKAACEMADRAGSLLPYGYFDLWISTFHSFAERILKEHGLAIGLSTDFQLLNEFEQWALIKKNLDKFALDYYRPLGNPTKFIRALVKHFSRAKDEDVSPSAYLEYANELRQDLDGMLSGGRKCQMSNVKCQKNKKSNRLAMTDKQEVLRLNEIANAFHVYQQLLLDNNALDFGDLINYCLKLFRERPAILEQYRRQFKYILLDEFQDTNWAQYELIKILAAPKNNLVVVGDDDQSIFRFRGASMSNILQFVKDYPKTKKIILVKNYRSEQNILDLSYEFIKRNNPNRLEYQLENQKSETPFRPEADHPLGGIPLYKGDETRLQPSFKRGVGGLNKKLMAENKGKGEIEVVQGADLAAEVRQVVDKICELKIKDKAVSWNDFAVLVRANDSARYFIAEFERRGLPYIFGAARGLYAKPVIMDAIAYFKLLDNYHESRALWRVLNLPVFKFTYQELVNFNYLAAKKAWSLYEVIDNGSALQFANGLEKKIKPVLALIGKHSAAAREKTVSEIFLTFMNDSGYLKYLTKEPGPQSLEAISLLNQFLKRIQAFESSADDKTVKAFLEELNLEIEAGEQGALAPDLEAGPEAIKILTVHGAKGLEFKYVFIANLVDKRFPTIERGEQINLPDALVKEILPEGDVHLAEERRLFYVAMTRAKAGLYFSWASDYGGKIKKKPSRFLVELGMVENDKTKNCHSRENGNPEIFSLGKAASVLDPRLRGDDKPITVPSHFSYSQLAAYSACPYQYRFAHILKIPVMGKEQLSFGKTLHATLQKLFALLNEKKGLGQADLFSGKTSPTPPLQGGQISPPSKGGIRGFITFEEILKLYEQSWIDDWYKDKKSKQDRRKQGQEILHVFYDKHKDNWPDVLFLEKGFNVPVPILPDVKSYPVPDLLPKGKSTSAAGPYIVRGVIDRIDQVGAGIKLVDYKTGQSKEKLSFEDKEQLLIYQLAASELFKQEVKALAFYYLDNNSEVEFIGQASDLEKIKVKIISTVKQIRQGQFPPKPGRLCVWCDYKEICEFRK